MYPGARGMKLHKNVLLCRIFLSSDANITERELQRFYAGGLPP